MKTEWKYATVSNIAVAVYVKPNSGGHTHRNRPYHGFVLNGKGCIRDYCFENGLVMHTEESSLFYLPKGSSYHVKTLSEGGCYAINFDATVNDPPFTLHVRGAEQLLRCFKTAAEHWKSGSVSARPYAMRAVYEAIGHCLKENERPYLPSERFALLSPAVDALTRDFTGEVSIAFLSALCGISEVYFRRLFLSAFGLSPKEYIIQKRIEYAKNLLSSTEYSVSEVAALCGYAEPCHFSREFSRRVGTPPGKYRKP